ncbi:phosphorylase [Methylomonas sp. LL1]|nr:phosphorylase [Methylomonas sp. LL1]
MTSPTVTNDADALVGIVVALPEELSTLTYHKLKLGECCRIGDTWVVYSGAGPANATKAAELLIDKGCRQLISWGCAAGLSPELKPGDLVLASQIVTEQQQFDTDSHWRSRILAFLPTGIPVHDGKLFSSAELVGSHQHKQRLHQTSLAIALDMESAAIAETAQRAGLPCLAVRAIADPAGMDLPQAVQRALDSDGQVVMAKLLRYLLTHPWEVVGLIRLGLHFHAAQTTLKLVARQFRIPGTYPPIAI